MGYKIADRFIEKISVPVACRIADQKFEFENGAECAKAEFEKTYIPADISVEDNKIVIYLEENAIEGKMPSYQADEKWVEQYKKDFGTEPSFF